MCSQDLAMPVQSYTQAPAKHTILDEDNQHQNMNPASLTTTSYSSPTPSYSPNPDHTTAETVHECCQLIPPISKATLSELDLDRLIGNLLLRHDLNFDHKIRYGPTVRGSRAESRVVEAQKYWDAMGTELSELYFGRPPLSNCSSSDCRCSTTPRSPPRDTALHYTRLLRLKQMFESVREIIKSLLPIEEWPTIDAGLDADLLVQELDNDACNFTALSDWLGTLLRRFMLPERRYLVDLMIAKIRDGVRNVDIDLIVDGLIRVFGILEVMKLDHANLNIQSLRPVMVDTTVEFEQQDFLRRIAEGWDVSQAHAWFAKEQKARRSSSSAFTLAMLVTGLIITDSTILPSTFTLDYIRLRSLQTQFKELTYQSACRWTFEEVLGLLQWEKLIPQSSYDNLFAQIRAISNDGEMRYDDLRRNEEVALQIVREAYKLCNIQSIPAFDDVEFAAINVAHASNPSTTVCKDLQTYLGEDLRDMVDREIRAIKDLTPMQISDRYRPETSSQITSSIISQQAELLHAAQQTAHISVLHWQVWAPILYNQPEIVPS